jgi:uncharacterized RDD family membrane protein YckC
MDMQTHSSSPRKAPVADDLFDDFDFKPLSKGLGFHHANKSEEAVKEATRVMVERAAPARPAALARSQHPFEQHRLAQASVEAPRDFVQNDLALFYAAKAEPQIQIEEAFVPVLAASKSLRLAAFSVDMIIVGGLTAGTLQSVSLMTGLDVWNEMWVLEPTMLTAIVLLFSGYFLLYFTLLEIFQGKSLGKDLMGITLATEHRPQMTLLFVRSLMTLLGFLSLGLTNAVELPGMITNTKVIRE